jgi:hypothetical protein
VVAAWCLADPLGQHFRCNAAWRARSQHSRITWNPAADKQERRFDKVETLTALVYFPAVVPVVVPSQPTSKGEFL